MLVSSNTKKHNDVYKCLLWKWKHKPRRMLENVDIQMLSAASQMSIKKYIEKWFLLYHMIRERKTRMADITAPTPYHW